MNKERNNMEKNQRCGLNTYNGNDGMAENQMKCVRIKWNLCNDIAIISNLFFITIKSDRNMQFYIVL